MKNYYLIMLLSSTLSLCGAEKAPDSTNSKPLPVGVDCMIMSYIVAPSYGAAVKKEWEVKRSLPFTKNYKKPHELQNGAEAFKSHNIEKPVIVFCISTIQAIAKVSRHFHARVNNNLIPIVNMLRKNHVRHDEEEIGLLLKNMAGAQKPEFTTWFDRIKLKLAYEHNLRLLAWGDEYLEQTNENIVYQLSVDPRVGEQMLRKVKNLTVSECIKWLLEGGADINAKSANLEHQETALLVAIQHREEIAIALIEQGASVIETDHLMTTPLMKAAYMGILNKGRKKLFELILSKCNNPEYLNRQDSSGDTALIKAASEGNTIAVQLLLAAGADKTIKSNGGYTAFDKARTEEIATLLI